MSFDLYSDEVDSRLSSLRPVQTPEPGVFDNFLAGSGKVAMQTFAKTGSALNLIGAVGPIVRDMETGGTEAQDQFFKRHEEVFGSAVDYWTPKPNEVGAAGQVVGQLLGTLPTVFASPATAVATTQLSVAEDLVKKGIDAGKAQGVGAVQAAGLGLGIWVPILGKTLAQRVLLGGAGFNAFQGAATRGVSGEILEGTAAAGDFKAFDATSLTLDVLLGAAFGGLAHINPRMRAEGEAWHAMLAEWGSKVKPSDADALLTLRQAQHVNADSMPGKPSEMIDADAHVQRMRKAIDDLANDRPVQVEDMPAGKFNADPARQTEAVKTADSLVQESVNAGAADEFDAALLRDDTLGTLPRGIVKGGIKAIRDIISFAKSGPANEKRGVRFATVEDAQAIAIRESIGADVSGYTHMIDNFGIRHALNEHGNPDVETRRGNVAITDADLLKAPEIVNTAERIESGGKDAAGRELVRYVKTVKDGTIYYVEEVRTKRNELAFKTMWKKPPARDMQPGEPAPAPLTSETLRGSDSNVAQKVGAGGTATSDPALASIEAFAADAKQRSIDGWMAERVEMQKIASGELTKAERARASARFRTTPDEATARIAELDGLIAGAGQRYSPTNEAMQAAYAMHAKNVGAETTATAEQSSVVPDTAPAVKDSLIADPVAAEAARFAADNPDLAIAIGKNADGSDITITPRQWLDQEADDIAMARDDAKLFEIAAGCLLGGSR